MSLFLIACTAFQLVSQNNEYLYCRSLEFGQNLESNVLVVARGTAFVGTAPQGDGMAWSAAYGFVGMNQNLDRYLVSDGMNEKGLAVGQLYLPDYAQYETPNPSRQKQTLGYWELPTYFLSTCATVQDVKNVLNKLHVPVQPVPLFGGIMPLHYYICDASGAVLIVEYTEGKMHSYDNPLGTLTNSPALPWHLQNLANYVKMSPFNAGDLDLPKKKIGNPSQGSGLLGLPGDFTAPSRFVRAALFSSFAQVPKTIEQTVALGFHVLNTFDVFFGIVRPSPNEKGDLDYTQWVTVCDRTNLKFYVRNYESLQIQSVDLKQIDFSKAGFKEMTLNKQLSVQPLK